MGLVDVVQSICFIIYSNKYSLRKRVSVSVPAASYKINYVNFNQVIYNAW